jgi:6-phosphogluconolactonase
MPNQNATATYVYAGGYTGFGPNRRGKGVGIDIFQMNPSTGALTHLDTLPGVENPSYLTVDRTNRFLYAVNGSPTTDGQPGGAVTACSIDQSTGRLTFLNRQLTMGQGPCHVTATHDGAYVLATSYQAGNVVVFPTKPDGSLKPASDLVQHVGSSVTPERQAGPHAHSVNFDLADRFALVCDLGLDRVFVYRLDRGTGKLVANDPPSVSARPGSGPRHLAFHPNGRFVFVINEINSTLTSYRYDQNRGVLTEIETLSTLPANFSGDNSTADVHVAPSGKFIYGSNRGHDSIVIYAFDEAAARLTTVGFEPTGGRNPRNFTLDDAGTLLLAANQDSDSIVTFRIDPASGKLASTGDVASSPTPTCVRIVKMG